MKILTKLVCSFLLSLLLLPMITVASTLFTVDDAGNVGIGTASPQYKLDVLGTMHSRLVNLDASSTPSSINLSSGNVQSFVLNSNPTLSFTNPQAGAEYKLIIKQDATGGRTITWPATVKWPSGNPPTLTTTANGVDTVDFVFDGVNYLGSYSLDYQLPVPPIAFDAATNCGGNASCSVTTSGSNRALIAYVLGDTSDNQPTCTYNGTSMTAIDKVQIPSDRWSYSLLLIAPTSGSHTLSCSGPSYIRISSVSYTGVKQTSQPDNYGHNTTSSGSSVSGSYTVNNNHSMIVQGTFAAGGSASSATTDSVAMTERGTTNTGVSIFDTDTNPASASSHTVAWTNSSSSNLSQLIISLIRAD